MMAFVMFMQWGGGGEAIFYTVYDDAPPLGPNCYFSYTFSDRKVPHLYMLWFNSIFGFIFLKPVHSFETGSFFYTKLAKHKGVWDQISYNNNNYG